MGFMVCTARIIVIALCCPRSSEPGSGRDVPAAAALTPEAACGEAPRGRGGHISLTILHPNNEACHLYKFGSSTTFNMAVCTYQWLM